MISSRLFFTIYKDMGYTLLRCHLQLLAGWETTAPGVLATRLQKVTSWICLIICGKRHIWWFVIIFNHYIICLICDIYIHTQIGIVWLRAPNESSPFHSSWTRTLLGGRVKRAQLLWNMHNFLQTWTTSMNSMTSSQTLQKALNQTIPTQITYIYMCIYIHIQYIIHNSIFRMALKWGVISPWNHAQIRKAQLAGKILRGCGWVPPFHAWGKNTHFLDEIRHFWG